MNILLITAMFPPVRTGTSFYSQNIASALMTKRHSVEVVTLENNAPYVDNYSFPVRRLPAIYFPVKNYFKHLRISSLSPLNYLKIKNIAIKMKADVIFLVNHYLDIAFPAAFVSRILKIPLICSIGTQLQSANPKRDKVLNVMDRLICGHLVFPFCTKIVAWDTEILRYLKDVHGAQIEKKCEIINYGVNGDLNSFATYSHDYSLHNQILGVGSVIEQRSYLPLVKAFNEIKDDFPALKIKIIGHIYHQVAVRLSKELGLCERIDFAGEKPHEEVLEELKKSDIFFVSLTGKYVGLGTATIEAMLSGLPVMANVPTELLDKAVLKDGIDFLYVDSNSISDIASKLSFLLKNEELRKRIGQSGRHFIDKNMNWDKVASDMEELFKKIVDTHG
jgi:glycosyltransferase involved in cell wall biosynthesis